MMRPKVGVMVRCLQRAKWRGGSAAAAGPQFPAPACPQGVGSIQTRRTKAGSAMGIFVPARPASVAGGQAIVREPQRGKREHQGVIQIASGTSTKTRRQTPHLMPIRCWAPPQVTRDDADAQQAAAMAPEDLLALLLCWRGPPERQTPSPGRSAIPRSGRQNEHQRRNQPQRNRHHQRHERQHRGAHGPSHTRR